MKNFRVGVDSYSLAPLGLSPFALMAWIKEHGGEGVQFSGPPLPEGGKTDSAFLADLAASARQLGLYLEWGGGQHIPFDQRQGWQPLDTAAINRRAAEQAAILGAAVVRSCSGGMMRWQAGSPETEFLVAEMARTLKQQRPMFEDLGVTLAIETHFEFTTFELRRLFDMCDAPPGGWLGICLDTMNLLTMLEDPLQGSKRILPWVAATHIKDGGIILAESGLVSFPAAIGKGIVDFSAVLRLLAAIGRDVHLSIEDHGGSFAIPVFDPSFLARFPDLTAAEFGMLLRLAAESRKKIDGGELGILDRSEWPLVCEAQVARDVRRLKDLAGDEAAKV